MSETLWYDLNQKRDGSPITLRRKAGSLANRLEKFAKAPHRKNQVYVSAHLLKKALRFSLARIQPKSADGVLLCEKHPTRWPRAYKNQCQIISLILRLSPVVDTVLDFMAQDRADPRFCFATAKQLRKVGGKDAPKPADDTTPKFFFQGKDWTIYQWSLETGIPGGVLRHRWCKGWNVERMLTTPIFSSSSSYGLLTHGGMTQSVNAWSAQLKVSETTIYRWLSRGWSIGEIATKKGKKTA